MTNKARNFVGGMWTPGDSSNGTVEVVDPRDGSLVEAIPAAGPELVDAAVAAARDALPTWAATPLTERLKVLRQFSNLIEVNRENLAEIMTSEIGVPAGFSRAIQVGRAKDVVDGVIEVLETFDFEETIGHSTVIKEPVGVVVAITPWNYPLYQVVAKLAPAVGVGCTVIVKPAGQAPLSVARLFELLQEAGLPSGVANLLIGKGGAIGDSLVTHPDVDVVSFTGSTEVGAHVAELAGREVKRATLELGGKSAGILADGADVEQAARQVVASSFLNSGQTCSAVTRLIVPRQRLAEVEAAVVVAAKQYIVGSTGRDGEIEIGPVSSFAQQHAVRKMIASGREDGARILVGGTDGVHPDGGAFVEPTVFSDVTRHMRIAREEIFGPVLVVIPVDSLDEAVDVANDTEYGLSGAVWAADDDEAIRIASRMRTGQVSINGGTFNSRAPFGGVKKSGYGRELGKFGIEEYLTLKSLQRR